MMRAVILALLLLVPAIGQAQAPAGKSASPVLELGDGRLQVGEILVDQRRQQLTVPGVALKRVDPIEFVAVTRGGHKAYESILELAATAHDFNLACILIGLDNSRATRPRQHFDPEPVRGMPVDIVVSWESDGRRHEVAAADLLSIDGAVPRSHRWRYTGSWFGPNGRYRAEEFGTLVGFVHDEDSVIHHREGLGLNNYGGVKLNTALAPPEGAAVVLTVRRPQGTNKASGQATGANKQ